MPTSNLAGGKLAVHRVVETSLSYLLYSLILV